MVVKARTESGPPGGGPAAAGQARLQYREMVARVRELVRRVVPADAHVLSVSRGDTGLIDIDGRRVTHFPQTEQGVYAGFHPADSTAAITHLESLRAKGAEYLVIPATAFWWFDHYRHFRRHLEARYRVVARDEDSCVVFALDGPGAGAGEAAGTDRDAGYRGLVTQVREVVEALLPEDSTVAVISGGDDALLVLGERHGLHYPAGDDGGFAGYYPADSAGAIDHLERLRAAGAAYLVVPQPSFWWLTHYEGFADHLARRYRRITCQAHVCMIYGLAAPA